MDNGIDTKEQILNVAERLFAEQGFTATSLRRLSSEAKVNLAAVHYHFGSKEELFRAVVSRIAQPIVSAQIEELTRREAKDRPLSVEAILEAFLSPPLQIVLSRGNGCNRARFMGRCRTEPATVQKIAEKEFQPSQEFFLAALGRSLPKQSSSELAWKLDLVIAVLLRVATEAGKPEALIQDSSPEDIATIVSCLVNFLAPGLSGEN